MITAAKDYRITASDLFFFDNNIWMFMYASIGNFASAKQRAYGDLFNYIIERKRPIYINSLVLSEFVNANLRSEYEIWKMKPENAFANKYKEHFLKSPVYKTVSKSILASVKSILAITTRGNDNFNTINLNAVFNEMSSCDFNDAYYLQYAQMSKYIIVTDDADLYRNNKSGVNIITYRI